MECWLIDINIDNIVAVLDPPTLKSRYWSFSKEKILTMFTKHVMENLEKIEL